MVVWTFGKELVLSLTNLKVKLKTHPNHSQKLLKNANPPSLFYPLVQSQAINPSDGRNTKRREL